MEYIESNGKLRLSGVPTFFFIPKRWYCGKLWPHEEPLDLYSHDPYRYHIDLRGMCPLCNDFIVRHGVDGKWESYFAWIKVKKIWRFLLQKVTLKK